MKVLRQVAFGSAAQALRLEDAPAPVPAPGEVLIAMEIAPIHGNELRALTDPARLGPGGLPRIGGTEGVGHVVACGEGVDGFAPGQRVFPPKYAGLFRERLCCPAAQVRPAPQDCAVEDLAMVQTMGLTAFLLLEDYAQLPPGSWIVQDAANSSIGRIIIGLARQRGLRTVNVVRRPGLEDELKALGGDAVVVDTGDGASLARAVSAACGGAVPHVGLDMVGGAQAARLMGCLSDGGQMVLYGCVSGQPAPVAFDDVMRRAVTVTGMGLSRSLARRDLAAQRDALTRVARLAADGVFRPLIAARYHITEFLAAFEHAAQPNGTRAGKVLLRLA